MRCDDTQWGAMHQVINVLTNTSFLILLSMTLFWQQKLVFPQRRNWVFRGYLLFVAVSSALYHGSRAADDSNSDESFTSTAGWLDVASVVGIVLWMIYQTAYTLLVAATPAQHFTKLDALMAAATLLTGLFYESYRIPWAVLYGLFFAGVCVLGLGTFLRFQQVLGGKVSRWLLALQTTLFIAAMLAFFIYIQLTNDGPASECSLGQVGHGVSHVLEAILMTVWWAVMSMHPPPSQLQLDDLER